ncbi:MAG: HD domain-containing protein [Lachnospiraceae bacterium]|nr:HD domain-containing protein [Lachnospiraceae bacterium]
MTENFSIKEILDKYKRNMDRQRELDASLLQEQEKQEWLACLQNRAVENQKMYMENGEILDALEKWLQSPLQEDTARLLYDECNSMYWDGYDDCQVLLPMLYKLIPYYEEAEDIPKLMFLYGAVFYEESEVQSRREGHPYHDESYNYKIISYKKDYFSGMDAKHRRRIWGAYYNLIVSGLGNRAISADESYRCYVEALDFWNSPEVQALDGENEKIIDIVERIKKEWLIVEEVIEESNEEAQSTFCKLAQEMYQEEIAQQESIWQINSEVYAAYLHAQKILNNMSLEEIVDAYLDYYQEKMKLCPDVKDLTEDDLYFLINAPLTIERWLCMGVEEEKSKKVMSLLKQQTQETWYEKLTKFAMPFINGVMAEWCFTLIKYMDTQDEKEECLFQLLVKRQLPTYLHSVMVTHLAEALCKEAKRKCPELFEGLPESIKKDLVGFVRRSALLHDIGKTKITDIVNTQGRRLWDREFHGIKNHPMFGAEMIEKDEDLVKYRDVVLGHHKFYDGSGGYPVEFDNTKSPCRVLIDLITICDCIDAATDHLGRNYKRAKTLDEVLKELVEGKGTRYNPDLVEVIEESSRLKKEMRYIVSEGRMDIMYRAYLESAL